ncbi:MAG TPA: radical SAM family heme chaperone HemW [Burkholderiaceae bacterium]|nr:radical SAM family heme chaperone HemW [Burkholderiaceae bacterium]
MIPIKPVGTKNRGATVTPMEAAAAFLKPGTIHLGALPPLSLYVHFPWCIRKCPYCDFNSHEAKGGFPEEDYIAALRTDLENALPLIWGRKIYTVFIGGGTPSLMSAAGLDRLLSDIRTLLPLDGAAEITMEANPGTFEMEKFRSYRSSGINRLSIGIQSFDSHHLHALGRIHDGNEARRAIDIAHASFDNFNLDLMYALPAQTLDQARNDIRTAIGFAPPHLSLYHLTLEPNTWFAKYPPVVPDEDASAEMQDMIEAETATAGYRHYEVSAYAKAGRQARHNLNYWQFGDYLGIGAGAHSKISFPHRVIRQARYKQPKTYLEQMQAGNPIQEEFEIKRSELGFEFMLNALRLVEGFEVNLFSERTGLPLNTLEKALSLAEGKGLLYRDYKIMKPTDLGKRFLNDLQQIFLTE